MADQRVDIVTNGFMCDTCNDTTPHSPTDCPPCITLYVGTDGRWVVEVDTTPSGPVHGDGNPAIRVYVNDGRVYGEPAATHSIESFTSTSATCTCGHVAILPAGHRAS
jgi:hypothetical protein